MTTNSGAGPSNTTTACPPDLLEQQQQEEEKEEDDLSSEACMELLHTALEEAASAPQPYKYHSEGGSQVRVWPGLAIAHSPT